MQSLFRLFCLAFLLAGSMAASHRPPPPSGYDAVHGYEEYKPLAAALYRGALEQSLSVIGCKWKDTGILEPGGAEATVLHYQLSPQALLYSDWVAVVVQGEEAAAFRTMPANASRLWLADVDGDGCVELVNFVFAGGNGDFSGTGYAQIYRVRDKTPVPLLPVQGGEWAEWTADTGFSLEKSDNFHYTVRNKFTGYEKRDVNTGKLCVLHENPETSVLKWFAPVDYDGDGVGEINCIEEWRGGRNPIGYAASILKYDGAGGWRVLKTEYMELNGADYTELNGFGQVYDQEYMETHGQQASQNRAFDTWYLESGEKQ